MPFTPCHFGPSACIALPLNRWIDLPVFLLANVAIDIEPLLGSSRGKTLEVEPPLTGAGGSLLERDLPPVPRRYEFRIPPPAGAGDSNSQGLTFGTFDVKLTLQ
jgi:hypothetical protein